MTEATPELPTAEAARPKGGAPPCNRNHLRHGLRGFGWPAGCVKDERNVNRFRRTLEDCIIEARGEIGLVDACLVATCYRWERHASLAARWLRLHGPEMDHTERLSYSREIARASAERDKAIAALNLPHRPDASPWTVITKDPAQ